MPLIDCEIYLDLDTLAEAIRSRAAHEGIDLSPPVGPGVMAAVEKQLGFAIPSPLRECYERVGNGGFGPGYGVIGIGDGFQSDFGDLVETFIQLRDDSNELGEQWPDKLLPFCEWGCNIYSCVDCDGPDLRIVAYDSQDKFALDYTLRAFFPKWLAGESVFPLD